jgi:WD40 repeat protein
VSLPSAAFHLEHNEDADLYIAGLGDGQIAFFNAQTRQLTTDKPFTSQMVTDAKLGTTNQRVAFTDEAGALRVYDRSNSAVIFDRTNAHSMCGQPVNAWSCEFLNDNLVASGGDDNLLKIWDLRDGGQRPIQLNKSHSGGVVRLIKLNEQLCTGSYDEKLRFFDLRSLNEPSTCVEVCF